MANGRFSHHVTLGLTLIEVLVSMALLTGVFVAVGAWIEITASAASSISEPLQWNQTAEATLRVIGDDLNTGDFETETTDYSEPRIEVDENTGALTFDARTAGHGAVTIEIKHDNNTNQLVRNVRQNQQTIASRVLIGAVQNWQCAVNEEATQLTIMIESINGHTAQRSFALP